MRDCNLILRFDDLAPNTTPELKEKVDCFFYNDFWSLNQKLVQNITYFHMSEEEFAVVCDGSAETSFLERKTDIPIVMTLKFLDREMQSFYKQTDDFKMKAAVVFFASFVLILPILVQCFV